MRRQIGRLHVLTDEVLQHRFSHVQIARLAAAGGADVIQYREKRALATEAIIHAARQIRGALPPEVQLVVDDRADVALAIAADAVHVGRHDMPADEVRAMLGDDCLIGGTANGIDEARRCFELPIDYLGAGPVYGTTSKQNPAAPLGLEALRAIASESPVPVIAIGGITPERVGEVLAAGAHGIAVLSGVACARDPEQAARRYRAELQRHLDPQSGATRKKVGR